MPEKDPRSVVPSSKGGFFFDLSQRAKLILRLIADPRVNPLLKAIPIGAVVYLVLFPDLAPGPIDDAAVIWMGMTLFIELCPPEVVKEHTEALARTIEGEMRDAPKAEDVVEGQFRDE